MSFSIKSIDQLAPESGKTYLFDANVWKFILLSPQNPNRFERAYIDFFGAIVNLASNPMCKKKPSIHVNGLIISEVFNALMKIYFEAYNATLTNKIAFKQYRTTQDYNAHYLSIKTDMQAYLQYLDLSSELFHKPDTVLFNIPAFSDYNDHYYFKIAQSQGFSVVTNDSDFKYTGIEIITFNNILLSLL